MYSRTRMDPRNHLPDPEYDAQFYQGVPGKRVAAWIVDFLIVLAAALAATLVIGILTLGLGFVFFPGILFLVSFFYRTLTIAEGSATWGMRVMGIEFRTRQGYRLDFLTAAVHTGIFMFLMATIVGWIATAIAILVTPYKQGLPDLVLGTTAINRPAD